MIGEDYFHAKCIEISPHQAPEAPNVPAIFLLWAEEGDPYLARTALLRRRLMRLLRDGDSPSRLLNLSGVARRIQYWTCGSRLESSILFYTLAQTHFPNQYLKIAKLRMPAYIKLTLANAFPRTQITTRFAGGRGLYYGPFRSRASAELFESRSLDLFQIRRCQENLEPRADHPGCIYGEMSMCLRPCQEVVNESEYATEAERYRLFLATAGSSLLESAGAARDHFSEQMQFEEAARQHKRYERIEEVLGLRDELVTHAECLNGVAITPSTHPHAVTLWCVANGEWADPVDFSLAVAPTAVSLDHRLRELFSNLRSPRVPSTTRQEHIALLAKWFYSSWRDGEWLSFESYESAPYRRIVNAIARVAKSE